MIKRLSLMLTVLATLVMLQGCSTGLDAYEQQTPVLKLEEFFKGDLVAHGMVEDYSGEVIQRFRVEMQGYWEGNEGRLEEQFYYADGTTQERIWYITKTGERTYEGRASDVEGVAKGEVSGFALNWVYVLNIEVDGEPLAVTLDDWLYLVDKDNMINRTQMSKFGLPVGEITLYIGRR